MITTVTLPGVAVAAGFTVGFLGAEVAVAAFVGAGVGVSVGSGVGVGVLVGNGVGVSVGTVVTVGVNVANSTSAEETSAGTGVVTVQELSVKARASNAKSSRCCIDICVCSCLMRVIVSFTILATG